MPSAKTKVKDDYEAAVARAIGAEVAKWRIKRGLDRKHLVPVLRCKERTVKSYELGARRFSIADIMRLARLLSVQPEILLINVPQAPATIPLAMLTDSGQVRKMHA
jgi:predicted transcriptional regulator